MFLGARRPLVYGLEHATVEAQRRAVEIADLIGGVIDPASSASHAASVLAFQRIGQVSATLGELRERADLIVYWDVDPEVHCPGFRARYIDGGAVPARATITVDIRGTGGSHAIDRRLDDSARRARPDVHERFDIDAASELEALWMLRARLRGRRLARESAQPLLPFLDSLVGRLRDCRYGVILHDADPPTHRGNPMLPLALSAVAIEASRTTHVRLIGIHRPGNAVGAETVLTWQTGFPFAIDFSRGYPRYAPGEFNAERLLARGEVDAALLVGVGAPLDLSASAVAHLERIPTIVVGEPDAWSGSETRARFATSPFEALAGSVYRMDGVALRRRPKERAGAAWAAPMVDGRDATIASPTSAQQPAEEYRARPLSPEPEDAAVLGRIYDAIRRRASLQDSERFAGAVRGPSSSTAS